MTEIESLGIAITADTKDAGKAIDNLVAKLGILSNSLSRVNGSNLTGLGQGVQALAQGMHSLKGIGDKKYIKLANGLSLIANVNAQGLDNAANSLANFAKSTSLLSGIQFDNKNIQNLINSLTRLANSKVDSLSNVDFTRLGASLNGLATSLQNAPKIQQSIISMTNAISNLSRFGGNIPAVASSLGALGNSLTMFMSTMANAPRITDSALAFTQAISSLAGAGAKAGVTASNLSALGVGIRNIMTTLSTAPKVSQNVIDMTNALANLSAQGSKVGSASRNMVYGLNRTSRSADRAKKSFSGLASVIGKFYANYFLVVRGFKALWKSIGSTSDYVESFNYYTVSFGKIASKWDKEWKNYGDENARNYSNAFVTTMNDTLKKLSGVSYNPKTGLLSETGLKNLGLNIQEVTNYAAQLASMMDSIGQNGEVTLATTKAFVKLAGDISSLKNIDYSDAANKIQSVLMGQSRAGYSLGWDTTMASLQATADSLNLSKSVSEMAQFEKQQLRILTILEQSRVAYGDQSNTINTLSNQIRLFRNNTKEAGLLVGQLFTPVMVNLMPVINGVTIALKRMLSYLGIALGANMKDVSQGFNDTEDGAFDMSEEIDGATESLKKYKNQAMDFDEINPIKGVDDSGSLGNLTGGSIDLTDEILQATKEYEKAWQESYDNMESRSQEIANRIVNGFKNAFKNAGWYGVGNYISSGIADSLANADFDSVHKGLENVARNIANFLNGLITPDLLGNVGKSFAKSLNAVINAKATLGENINFDQVGDSIAEGINNFFDTFDFGRMAESLNTWVKGLTKALIKAVKEIDWNDVIKGFAELITSLEPETILILTSLWFLRGGGLPGLPGLPGIGGGNQSGGGFVAGAATATTLSSPATVIAGTAAAIIGSLLGEDAGRKVFGDEAYDEYGTVESVLEVLTSLDEIKPEWVEQAYNSFVNGLIGTDGLLDKGIGNVADKVDDAFYEFNKPMFEFLDDIFWFSAKHDEDWEDWKKNVKTDVLKALLIYEPEPEEKKKTGSSVVAGASGGGNISDEEWAEFFEVTIPDMKAKGEQAMLDFFIGVEKASNNAGVMATATTNIANQMVTMYGKLSGKAKDQGKGLVWNLGNGITVNQTQATSAFETLASSLLTVANDKYKAIKENVLSKGKGISTNFGTGMTDNKNKVTNAFEGLSTALSKVMDSKYDTLKTNITGKGEGLVWNLGNAITTNKKSATDPITKIFNSIGKIASSTTVTDKFESAGVNIIKGLISGLKDKKSLSNLATTVAGLGKSVAGIFTGVLDIHSPSRLFEKYAMYTIQGYNIGLEKYAPTTLDSMEDWSSSIANTSFSMEYPGVSANSEELLLLRQQNMLLQALLNKETVEIKGDAKQIFKVVQKQANNYTIQTGEPAFSF